MYPIRVPSKAAASSGLEIQESPISKNRPENDPYTVIHILPTFKHIIDVCICRKFHLGGGGKG